MSDTNNKQEELKGLQLEFQQLCVKSGALAFEIEQKKKDLSLLQDSMRDISDRFVKLKGEIDAEEKKSEEPGNG